MSSSPIGVSHLADPGECKQHQWCEDRSRVADGPGLASCKLNLGLAILHSEYVDDPLATGHSSPINPRPLVMHHIQLPDAPVAQDLHTVPWQQVTHEGQLQHRQCPTEMQPLVSKAPGQGLAIHHTWFYYCNNNQCVLSETCLYTILCWLIIAFTHYIY